MFKRSIVQFFGTGCKINIINIIISLRDTFTFALVLIRQRADENSQGQPDGATIGDGGVTGDSPDRVQSRDVTSGFAKLRQRPGGQCYKTFSVRNLRIFGIS